MHWCWAWFELVQWFRQYWSFLCRGLHLPSPHSFVVIAEWLWEPQAFPFTTLYDRACPLWWHLEDCIRDMYSAGLSSSHKPLFPDCLFWVLWKGPHTLLTSCWYFHYFFLFSQWNLKPSIMPCCWQKASPVITLLPVSVTSPPLINAGTQ